MRKIFYYFTSHEKKAGLINRLRKMMGEAPDEMAKPEPSDPVEIPEDTPYYLNPEVLNADIMESKEETKGDQPLNYAAEEAEPLPVEGVEEKNT